MNDSTAPDQRIEMPRSPEAAADMLMRKSFPLFRSTAENMQKLDNNSGGSMDSVCDIMLHDPGAILALLRKVNSVPRGRLSSDVTTLESAAMMIGIDAVKTIPSQMEIIDLPGKSVHVRGYMQVISRAFHAAYQAYDWATRHADMMPKEVFVAAFLHEIGKLALWLNGGEEMQKIGELIHKDHMPADEAQYIVLGFSIDQLSYALARRWKISEFVTDTLSADKANNPRVYGVKLACQLARLAEEGWYTRPMLECLENIAEYLEISFSAAVRLVHQNAIGAAHETAYYGVVPVAALLPMIVEEEQDDDENIDHTEKDEVLHFCLAPQIDIYKECYLKIKTSASEMDVDSLMRHVMQGLHDGLGLNRVVFSMLGTDRTSLKGRYLLGTDNDPYFSKFRLSLDPVNLFTHLLKKPQSLWINNENREIFWRFIPDSFKDLVETDSFYVSSVFVNDRPIGMFYTDRHTADCFLDEASYQRFKQITQLTGKALEEQRGAKKHSIAG